MCFVYFIIMLCRSPLMGRLASQIGIDAGPCESTKITFEY